MMVHSPISSSSQETPTAKAIVNRRPWEDSPQKGKKHNTIVSIVFSNNTKDGDLRLRWLSVALATYAILLSTLTLKSLFYHYRDERTVRMHVVVLMFNVLRTWIRVKNSGKLPKEKTSPNPCVQTIRAAHWESIWNVNSVLVLSWY